VHAGPSSYGADQNHDGGVPAQQYGDGEFPEDYNGRDYSEDYVGDRYEQDGYEGEEYTYEDEEYTHEDEEYTHEDEEYTYDDDIQEEVLPGPVNPQAWDPSFHLDPSKTPLDAHLASP
jgi:hypothetical protein